MSNQMGNIQNLGGALQADAKGCISYDFLEAKQVKEPTLYQRSHELLGYLHELSDLHARIRCQLFGTGEEGGVTEKEHSSIESVLARATQLAAGLAGEAKGILSRL